MSWWRTVACGALAALVVPTLTPSAQAAPVAADYTPPEHLEQGWYDALGIAKAQAAAKGGEGATIALFDSYLDTTVPDLQGADITIRKGCEGKPTPQVRGRQADHGTAMATALVGQGTGNGAGGRGVLGVAPRAKLDFYSVEAIHDDGEIDCSGYFTEEMILRAARNGADVISFSMTGGQFSNMDETLKKANELGAVVVASSGDRRSFEVVGDPASVPGVVSIGAVDNEGYPWEFNPEPVLGFNFDIDFVSAGVGTELGGFDDSGSWVSGGVRTGTSGATAIAAGTFALLAAVYPDATAAQRIQAAIHAGNDTGDPKWTKASGYGVPLINAMLEKDPAGWPDENPLELRPRKAMKTYPASVYEDPSAQAEETSSDAEAQEATAEAEQEPAAATADPEEAAGGPPLGALAAGGGLGLAVLLGAVLLARRRRADA